MCPVCLATAAWIAGSAISTGGLAVVVIKSVRAKTFAHEFSIQPEIKEDQHDE